MTIYGRQEMGRTRRPAGRKGKEQIRTNALANKEHDMRAI
jgi:hypothetical protein